MFSVKRSFLLFSQSPFFGCITVKESLHIGLVGLGCRGTFLLKDCLLPRPEIQVGAVCDVYEDRCEDAARLVRESGRPEPFTCTDYRQMLARGGLDLVMITAAWEAHVDIACASMRAGIYTAMEVGGAYSVEDCWRLVDTFEETGVPCMMMENCCYGRNELLVLNMVRQGIFGEIVHCQGGYRHDLRSEIAFGRENRHYRFHNVDKLCIELFQYLLGGFLLSYYKSFVFYNAILI